MVIVNTISVIYRFRKQDGRYLSKSLRYFSGLVMSRRWWAGPGLGWASPARPGPANFQRVGRGPARPIKISEDGPRPGPAHHIFNLSRPGPARPINFSKVSARPGPGHHIFKSLDTVRPGPDKRPMTSPDIYIPDTKKTSYPLLFNTRASSTSLSSLGSVV